MEMWEQKAANQLVSPFEAELMDGAAGFLGSKGNNDPCEEIENESRVDFNHNAILGFGDDVLEGEHIFDQVEKDLNLPTLRIKVIN